MVAARPTQVFIEMFRRRGVDITEAEAREPMGMAKHAHIATIIAMPRVRSLWMSEHGREPTSQDVDAIYADFLPMQKSTLASHCDVIPGVPQMVEQLRSRGLKIGSSTGYTRELMDVVVPLAAANGYSPDVVICSDDVSVGRPAPWMNFHTAERLGVYPMAHVLVVDDTTVGIAAGKHAGAVTVAVTRTGNALGLSLAEVESLAPAELQRRLKAAEENFFAAGADFVLQSAAEITQLLGD